MEEKDERSCGSQKYNKFNVLLERGHRHSKRKRREIERKNREREIGKQNEMETAAFEKYLK